MYAVKVMDHKHNNSVHEQTYKALSDAFIQAEKWHRIFPYNNIKINHDIIYFAKENEEELDKITMPHIKNKPKIKQAIIKVMYDESELEKIGSSLEQELKWLQDSGITTDVILYGEES